jgi:uncharacterized protein with HEPN domain
MKPVYSDYLNDILNSMELSQLFIQDYTLLTFCADGKTQFAVIRCLEIIGEAVKRLPDELRNENPDVPWKAMAGMRDRLIHGYDVVDPEVIWITVKITIPEIIPKIKDIIETT